MKINIASSKFYKASNHKNKIDAAYNQFFNQKIVIQHPEQLSGGDDAVEDQKELHQRLAKETAPDVSKHENFDSPRNSTSINFTPASEFSDNNMMQNPEAEKSESNNGNNAEIDNDSTNTSLDNNASNNTSSSASLPAKPNIDDNLIHSSTIEAQTVLYNHQISSESLSNQIISDLNLVVGQLNSVDSTSGARYARLVDNDNSNELWIYYSDSKNLNDIMEPAIKLLCQSGYSYLSFSRLARKDNAIVFDIVMSNEAKFEHKSNE